MELNIHSGNIHTIYVQFNNSAHYYTLCDDDRVSKKHRDVGNNLIWGFAFNACFPKGLVHRTETAFCGQSCRTLEEFQKEWNTFLSPANICAKDVPITRCDFKFDYTEKETAPWIKMCELLIEAFAVKNLVTAKNRTYSKAHMFGKHKNSAAKYGCLEVVNYNKKLQKPEGDVEYRLELRQVDKQGLEIESTLRQWIRELKSLKPYYDDALKNMNRMLLARWEEIHDVNERGCIKLSDFIRVNHTGIYSRKQLRNFFELFGFQNAKRRADRFCDRFNKQERGFISKGEFCTFVDTLCDLIEQYLTAKVDTQKMGHILYEKIRSFSF